MVATSRPVNVLYTHPWFIDALSQLHVFQNLPRNTEAFQGLRDAAINADHMNDCADFLFRDAIVQRASAMGFPFVHFAQGTDHGKIHH